MAIEVNGEPVAMKDFYPNLNPPQGTKRVLFKRSNFEPHKRIVSSLDRGPNVDPAPMWQAATVNVDSGGIIIPLKFSAAMDLDPKAQNATMQEVHYFETKTTQQMGNASIQVFTGDDLFMRGGGYSLDVTTPTGLQVYRVLMASPYNAANAVRYGQRNPLFEMVDIEGSRKAQNSLLIQKNRAIALAFNETEVPNTLAIQLHKEIAPYVNSSSASTDELVLASNFNTIRGDLSVYAGSYPDKFEKLVADANVGTRGLIKEAVEKKFLVQEKYVWKWGEIKAVKKNPEIVVIAVGQDPVQELLNHFVTKVGRKDLALLELEME